ncbi:MAG TPA: homocysteine S-methyltransferase family protein [Isosphaeraceae bacterium]|nr:homocysteine S-methyltransferase family protein [Isosphaeraceae bacterium]
MADRVRAALGRGALLLDAAMGTRLIARGLDLGADDPALWNLGRPEAVARVHDSDVAAGSEAVLTNTFGANRAWLARYGRADRVGAINRRAVGLARRAVGGGRFVLGSIGPTAVETPEAVREQAELLAEADVDALLFETYRADQAERALREVAGRVRIPLLVSLVAWPEPLAEIARRLDDRGAEAVGGNCQDGMAPALRLAERLRAVTRRPLIVKPSAGRPGTEPASPASFAQAAPALRSLGPVLVGGCCGTTEAHVAAIRAAWYAAGGRTVPGGTPP